MTNTVSRRSAITGIGTVALAGLTGLASPAVARADQGPVGRVHDVADHGAVGDGVTDDTAAFQAAIDAIAAEGGGTLRIRPATYVLAPVVPVILRADNMTVQAHGATFLRPYRKPRPSVMFVSNTRGTPGYGSGVRNLTWRGGRFVGDLATGNAICPFGLHHAQNCLFEGIVSENCHASGSHQFDLGGCDSITIRNCTFRGQDWTATAGAEAVQIDASYRGTLSNGTENAGFSGLMSRRITVEHCTFEPFTDAAGTVWPGPTPMGNHFAVEGKYYEDIRFAHNTVREPRTSVLFGDHRDTWRGVVHFVAVRGLEVVGNDFTMTQSRQTRVIAANSIEYGAVASADPAVGSPKGIWEVPNSTGDILIADNRINGFTVEPGVDELGAVVVLGLPGAEATNVTIRGNRISGGYEPAAASHAGAIEVSHAEQVDVERNGAVDYWAGIRLTSVADATVRANRIRNATGTEFPAGIVGRDLVDPAVTPGPTRGYATPVDID